MKSSKAKAAVVAATAALTVSASAPSAAAEVTLRMVHGTFAGTVRNMCEKPDGSDRYSCDISGASSLCSETGSATIPIGTDCAFWFENAYENLTFTRDCSATYSAAGVYYSGLLGLSFGYVVSIKQVAGQGSGTGSFIDAGGRRIGTVNFSYKSTCVAGVSAGTLNGTFEYADVA